MDTVNGTTIVVLTCEARTRQWTKPAAPWHHWTSRSEPLPSDDGKLPLAIRQANRKSNVGRISLSRISWLKHCLACKEKYLQKIIIKHPVLFVLVAQTDVLIRQDRDPVEKRAKAIEMRRCTSSMR